MWNNSRSIKLSSVLLKIAFGGFIAAAFFVPAIVKWYYPYLETKSADYIVLVSGLYLLIVCGVFAVIKLDALMKNLKNNAVFIEANVICLKLISYSCFAASIVFAGIGFVWLPSFIIAAAAAFLGLIIRIVRYVFTKAVELREENDAVI